MQSPVNGGITRLSINGIDVQIGSTVFIQAVPNDSFVIFTLDGIARLEVDGDVQIIPAGTFSQVPLDENGVAAGPPSEAAPYDPVRIENLPLGTELTEPIDISSPLDQESIPQVIQQALNLRFLFAIGDRVVISSDVLNVFLWSNPDFTSQVGFVLSGTPGTVLAGPIWVETDRVTGPTYLVQFDYAEVLGDLSGNVGWLPMLFSVLE